MLLLLYTDFFFLPTKVISAERSTLSSLLESLLRWQGLRWGGLDLATASNDDLCELLAEINDDILERAGTSLDEAAGIKRGGSRGDDAAKEGRRGGEPELLELSEVAAGKGGQEKSLSGSWNRTPAIRPFPGNEDVKLVTARNVLRLVNRKLTFAGVSCHL